MLDRPRLRYLEPTPTTYQGESFQLLRDPSGLSQEVVALRPVGLFLVSLLNGRRTRDEVRALFQERTGTPVERADLDSIIEQLDAALLLESPRLAAALQALPTRPAAHAGSAYPEVGGELANFLDDILRLDAPSKAGRRQVGTMAPHIDLRRGARCYSLAYNELKQEPPEVDTFVVLGISHAPCANPYILTRKNFETPLGTVETDVGLVEELARGCDFDPFQDEVNHLAEHSVEFQAVFLRHLFPGARIVPVLCGSFHQPLLEGGRPEDYPGIGSFIQALGKQMGPKVMLLSGVDLAHCGQRFGGDRLSGSDLTDLAEADRQSLAKAVEGDARGFFATLQADGGARNYCGTPAIYTMLSVLERSGRLHAYDQCNEPGNTSTVTVAAAGYYS
jgi:AmmeMemoRadiSam system protein B